MWYVVALNNSQKNKNIKQLIARECIILLTEKMTKSDG